MGEVGAGKDTGRVVYTGSQEPVCVRLLNSLESHWQSAFNWYGKPDSELVTNQFRKSNWAAGVYFQGELVLLVCVDDILLAGERSTIKTRGILSKTPSQFGS